MPRPLSIDLRARVLAAIDAGLSCRQAAERFGVASAQLGGQHLLDVGLEGVAVHRSVQDERSDQAI